MEPGAGEIGRVATPDGVDVQAVHTVRQAGRFDAESDASGRLPGAHTANRLARRVNQRDRRSSERLNGRAGVQRQGDST